MIFKSLLGDIIPYALIGIMCFFIGYWIGTGEDPVMPEPVERIITPYKASISIPQPNLTPSLRFVIVDQSKTDTVTVERIVRVPVAMREQNLHILSDRPLSISSQNIYLRYYDTDRGSYIIDQFEIQPKRFDFDLAAGIKAINMLEHPVFYPAATARMRWNRLNLQATAFTDFDSMGITGTLTYSIIQL